jgi:hypothetical protein
MRFFKSSHLSQQGFKNVRNHLENHTNTVIISHRTRISSWSAALRCVQSQIKQNYVTLILLFYLKLIKAVIKVQNQPQSFMACDTTNGTAHVVLSEETFRTYTDHNEETEATQLESIQSNSTEHNSS